MSLRRALGLVLPIAMMLPLGCKTEAGPESPATSAAEAAQAPSPVEHGHRKGHHGIVGQMFRAARQLDLSDAQRSTVQSLAAGMRGDHAGPPAGMKAYHSALVAQVRDGRIDLAGLDALRAGGDSARTARQAKAAAALDGLYAALTPEQRTTLVASIRAHRGEHHQRAAGGSWAGHRVEHLTRQLDLDAAQQKQVEALVAKDSAPAGEAKGDREAVLTAFASDRFDAKSLPLEPHAEKGPAGHARFLASLVPILRPDQREKLAADMERGPRSAPKAQEPAEEVL